MTKISMVRVQLVKAGNVEIGTNMMKHPDDAVRMILAIYEKEYGGAMPDREVLGTLFLNTKNKVTGAEFVSVGTLNAALIHPREVYKAAILHNAASIIIFHNHPSGDPTPSPEDLRMAKLMNEAGQVLGIELLDFLVIGEHDAYISTKELGVF